MATKDSNSTAILDALTGVRIAVFGDFCVDAYWCITDEGQPETSLETGLPVRAVGEQRYLPGGAGNVVANLIDLGVGQVSAVGVVGQDLFGGLLRQMLRDRGTNTDGLLTADDDWPTPTYLKPHLGGREESRFDFGGRRAPSLSIQRQLLDAIDQAASDADAVIINQQLTAGVIPQSFVADLNRLIAAHADTAFIADTRDHAHRFEGAVVKLNASEAGRLVRSDSAGDRMNEAEATDCARRLSERTGRAVFLTRGAHGIVVASDGRVRSVPGVQVLGETDPVGAGDTTVAVIAAGMACGHDPYAVATLANLAASVTVRKLQTTGTATPAEIATAADMPDYIYQPELAADARQARHLPGTEIEVIGNPPAELDIRHAIFDHDGTLSTLREGWERIMQPMMVRAVLGPQWEAADAELYRRVVDAVDRFIDETTGIQTLVQMQGLVGLVERFGCVAHDEILDEHGYKAVYNRELLKTVQRRVEKLDRGELDPRDFHIKNARALLDLLDDQGVKLYLASGTDEQDVVAEAEALGYAHLFEGRIFGAVGDVKVEAKKLVLERIIREHDLDGSELVTFGDGPVELRETRKRGGVCVGVASDEVRRFGLNPAKRTRLIRAGATFVVPDFSQLGPLTDLLQLHSTARVS